MPVIHTSAHIAHLSHRADTSAYITCGGIGPQSGRIAIKPCSVIRNYIYDTACALGIILGPRLCYDLYFLNRRSRHAAQDLFIIGRQRGVRLAVKEYAEIALAFHLDIAVGIHT